MKQFLLLREALMDYDFAKALCSMGVKPPVKAPLLDTSPCSLEKKALLEGDAVDSPLPVYAGEEGALICLLYSCQ